MSASEPTATENASPTDDDGSSPSEDASPSEGAGSGDTSGSPTGDASPSDDASAAPSEGESAPADPAPSDDGSSPEAGAFGAKEGFATGAQVDLAQDTGAEELVEGWKECRLATMGSFRAPASFFVENITADQAEVTDATVREALGQTIGGYHLAKEPAAAPEGWTVVDAPEQTVLDTPEMGQDNERYLRTLVLDGPAGPHLLIDQASVPAGAEPSSLEHWDVVLIGESSHAQVWASIPLESVEAAASAMETDLYREARSMVASYLEGQQ